MPEDLDNLRYVHDPRGVRRRQLRRRTVEGPIEELLDKYFDQAPALSAFQHGSFFDLEGLAIFVNSAPLSGSEVKELPTVVQMAPGADCGMTVSADELLRQSILAQMLGHLTGYPITVRIERSVTVVIRPAV
jgi:hypothetical protein